MDKDQFEKIFEEKFSSFEQTTDDEMKANVFTALNSSGSFWTKKIVIATLVLMFGVGVYFTIRSISKNDLEQELLASQSNQPSADRLHSAETDTQNKAYVSTENKHELLKTDKSTPEEHFDVKRKLNKTEESPSLVGDEPSEIDTNLSFFNDAVEEKTNVSTENKHELLKTDKSIPEEHVVVKRKLNKTEENLLLVGDEPSEIDTNLSFFNDAVEEKTNVSTENKHELLKTDKSTPEEHVDVKRTLNKTEENPALVGDEPSEIDTNLSFFHGVVEEKTNVSAENKHEVLKTDKSTPEEHVDVKRTLNKTEENPSLVGDEPSEIDTNLSFFNDAVEEKTNVSAITETVKPSSDTEGQVDQLIELDNSLTEDANINSVNKNQNEPVVEVKDPIITSSDETIDNMNLLAMGEEDDKNLQEVNSKGEEVVLVELGNQEAVDTILPSIKPSKWFATLGFETFMGYNNIEVNKKDLLLISEVENEPLVSLDRAGFRAQVGIGFQLNEKVSWLVQLTGQMAQYNIAYKGQSTAYDSLTVVEINDVTNIKVHRSKESRKIDINRLGIGLKTGVNYLYLNRDKLKNSVELSLSYLVDVNSSENYLRQNQLYLMVGHRFDYWITKRLGILIAPSIAYSLLNNKGNYELSLNPYSLGLGVGVTYRLNKKQY